MKQAFMSKLRTLFLLMTYFPTLLRMISERLAGKKIIAYQLGSPGQLQFTYPIHQALIQEKAKLAFYVSLDYPMPSLLSKMGLREQQYFPSQIAKFMFPIQLFLGAEIQSRGPKNAIKIFTGHGHANKLSHWAPESLRAFDAYFLYSPLERSMFEVIQKEQPEASKHLQLLNIGYPKIDDLVNGNFDRASILAQLQLDPTLQTVIYAPAWDPGGSLRTHGLEIINILLSIENINVLVKLHPASMEPTDSPNFEFYTGGISWKTEFAQFTAHPRFRFIEEYTINPYLFISDLMVNDFSGVALEYMALNRPILYIDCPEYYEKTLPSWECCPELAKEDDRFNAGRNAGSVIMRLSDLKSQVEKELAMPTLNEAKRQQFALQVMYNPGKGAVTASTTLLNMLTRKKND